MPALIRVQFSRRQLSDSSFVEFVRSPSGLDGPSSLLGLIPEFENKAFSCQIRHLHTIEQVLSEFQATVSSCIQAAEGWSHLRHKSGLGGKMAMVTCQSKPLLGLVFHH